MIAGAAPPCSNAQRVPGGSLERRYQPTRLEPIKLRYEVPGVGRERLGELVGFGKKGLTPIGRQSGLMERAYEIDAGERRGGRRLDDHRAADGHRRGDLMHDQVERMVERRDRRDHADRLFRGEGPPSVARGRETHWDFPAGKVA
jgi:hypothetical protein